MRRILRSSLWCLPMAIGLMALLSSCLVDRKVDECMVFERVPKSLWSPQAPVRFTFLCERPSAVYVSEIIVRHDSDFKYTKLKLRAVLRLRDRMIRTDTIVGTMAAEPLRWNGSGVALVSCRLPLYDQLFLSEPGIYTIELSPLLWRTSLHGIENVGLHIWRLEE